MKVSNTTPGAIILPKGELVPAGGTSDDIDAKDWALHLKHPVVAGMVAEGKLVEAKETPAPKTKAPTKDAE